MTTCGAIIERSLSHVTKKWGTARGSADGECVSERLKCGNAIKIGLLQKDQLLLRA